MMDYLDRLIDSIINDPVYLILACIIVLIIALVFFKDMFERILDGIMDQTTDIKQPYPVRADVFTRKVADGLDRAISKVNKRKRLLEMIKKLVLSDFMKNYFIKVMKKYPNVIEDQSLPQ